MKHRFIVYGYKCLKCYTRAPDYFPNCDHCQGTEREPCPMLELK
jgi:hypothetical protein